MKKLRKEIVIYSNGSIYCSVCANMQLSKKEIETKVNMENSTEINSQWKVSNENFSDGTKNPNQCEQDETRKHYLMVC